MNTLVGLVSASAVAAVITTGMIGGGEAAAQTMRPPAAPPSQASPQAPPSQAGPQAQPSPAGPQAQPSPQPPPPGPQAPPSQAGPPPQVQPYSPPPQAYPPPPQGYTPPPQGYYYPPQGYYPQPMLTLEEREVLEEGEISGGRVLFGVVLNGWLGLGLGQAVEGRWSDTGWIFTVGEPVALTVAFSTLLGCDGHDGCSGGQRSLIAASLLGYFGLRIWSIVDAITGPDHHNRRVRDLRMRLGMSPPELSLTPYLLPTAEGQGATAGLSLRF